VKLELTNYYNQLQSKDILLSYKGAVNNDLLDCLMKLTEDKLNLLESSRGLKKKVYTVVVEILQNIYHHFDPKYFTQESDMDSIAFVIGKDSTDFSIIAGNYIENDKVIPMREVIDELNSLSAQQLKQRYIQALNNGSFTQKGGAGLGLLFIARKSGGKLEYVIKDAEFNHSFFSLKVKISA